MNIKLLIVIWAAPSVAFASSVSTPAETLKAVQQYGASYGAFLAEANRCQDALENLDPARNELCRSFTLTYTTRFEQMKKASTLCIEQLKDFSALQAKDSWLANDVSAHCGTLKDLNGGPRFRAVTDIMRKTP